ncbi:MAG: DUF58 domain-containing protein [Coraliomargaritaceae bacterium]
MLDALENRLNLLEIKCRRPVEHLLAGEYRSIFHGRGIEFEDVRPYQPGEDVRTMDWKVTARTGVAHIKRYVEEREQAIYLLVDASASLSRKANSKIRKKSNEVCSLLTLSAIKNNDRVGLILFTDSVERIIPPGKGHSHAMRILHELISFQPKARGTNINEALQNFRHLARKYSIVFVISDFLTDDFTKELEALSIKHDVNAIHLMEENPLSTTASGLVRVEDSESGRQTIVDTKSWKSDSIRSHMTQVNDTLNNCGVHTIQITEDADCVEALAGFFRARQQETKNESGG